MDSLKENKAMDNFMKVGRDSRARAGWRMRVKSHLGPAGPQQGRTLQGACLDHHLQI